MAKSMKFELNRAGVRALMQSEEMQAVLLEYANEIGDRAGEGYEAYVGRNRANVSVRTETEEAARDNFNNNTLLKSLGGGKK